MSISAAQNGCLAAAAPRGQLARAGVPQAQREGFGHLLNLVGYTAIKDTGIFSVKTKVVPVFTVPVLNSPIF